MRPIFDNTAPTSASTASTLASNMLTVAFCFSSTSSSSGAFKGQLAESHFLVLSQPKGNRLVMEFSGIFTTDFCFPLEWNSARPQRWSVSNPAAVQGYLSHTEHRTATSWTSPAAPGSGQSCTRWAVPPGWRRPRCLRWGEIYRWTRPCTGRSARHLLAGWRPSHPSHRSFYKRRCSTGTAATAPPARCACRWWNSPADWCRILIWCRWCRTPCLWGNTHTHTHRPMVNFETEPLTSRIRKRSGCTVRLGLVM